MKGLGVAYEAPEDHGLAPPASRWRLALGITLVGVVALLAIYRDTAVSIVDIWLRSETFAHGFIIFPISAWLIWRRRAELTKRVPEADYRALPVFFLVGLLWLAARVAGVLVVEQYALVLMIPAMVWLVLGWRVAWELAFPLGFLLFAVPNGEFLVPPMMDFTADFTVKLLQMTGIPVYREGTFFSIPSGDWSVVEGCSGLRYLIASITLGFLYAYLTYRSYWRRVGFIALSLIFPVIANGLRAYMIVMIAHLSDMQLALGVDHFIYGWLFFGLVMLLLFWLGSFFAEPELAADDSPRAAFPGRPAGPRHWPAYLSPLVLALAVAAIWPARAAYLDRLAETRNEPVRLDLPERAGPWRATPPVTDWEPDYQGPDAEFERAYTDGRRAVTLYVLYYRSQEQGAELVNSRNMLVRQKHAVWRMPQEKPVDAMIAGSPARILQGQLQSPEQELLTWRWNRFGTTATISSALGKLLEAKDKMLGNIKDAAGIVLATESGEDPAVAAATLEDFAAAMWPILEQQLDRAASGAAP